MRISINGKGMEVSDYLRDVITKRVDKLDKYFRKDTEAKVMLSMLRGRQVVVRPESRSHFMRTALNIT